MFTRDASVATFCLAGLAAAGLGCGGATALEEQEPAPPPPAAGGPTGAGMVKLALGGDLLECAARVAVADRDLRIDCAADRVPSFRLVFPDAGAGAFDCGGNGAGLALSVRLDARDADRTVLSTANAGGTCGVVVHGAAPMIEGAFWGRFMLAAAAAPVVVPIAGSFSVERPAGR